MAEDKVVQTILRYVVDQASLKQAVASTEQLRAANKNAAAGVGQIEAANLKAISAANRSKAANDQLRASLDSLRGNSAAANLGRSYGILARDITKADDAAKQLAKDLAEIGASSGDISRAAREFERFRTISADALTLPDVAKGGVGGVGGSGGAFAGRGQRSPLSRIGSEIRNLPSIQTGLGFGTDAIGSILRVSGALDGLIQKMPLVASTTAALTPVLGATGAAFGGLLVAAIPVVTVVGGLIAVFSEMYRRAEEARQAALSELDARSQVVAIINTGNAEEIQAARDKLEIEKKNANERKAVLESFAERLKPLVSESANEGGSETAEKGITALKDQLVGLGEISQQTADNISGAVLLNVLQDKITEFGKTASEGTSGIEAYNAALDSAIVKQGAQLDSIRQASEDLQKFAEIARTGSSESLNALIASNKSRIDINNQEIKMIEASGLQTLAAKARVDELTENTRKLTAENFILNSSVRDSIRVREDAAAAEKIKSDQIEATKKFNLDIENLNKQQFESQIRLYDQLIEKQTGIGQKAIEDSQRALEQLLDKQASLRTNIDRKLASDAEKEAFDALQRQIKFQRNEVVEERRFQQEIDKIKRDAKDRERELGLDRDFAGLAASRRQTARAISEANIEANEQRAERLQRFADENTDQQAQFVFQRQQTLTKYAQDLRDAEDFERKQQRLIIDNKNKQLTAAVNAYNADLRNLNTKFSNEIRMRQAAIQVELQTIAAGETAKNRLLEQYYLQAQQMIRGIFGTVIREPTAFPGRPAPTPFAMGGRIRGGRLARVNEPGSSGMESYTNRYGTLELPGYGLFQPFYNGTINRNADNRSIVMNFSPIIQTGASPDSVRQLVPAFRQVAEDVVADAVNRIYNS